MLATVGCSKTPQEQAKLTKEYFREPEFVGKLPDGRIVMRVFAQVDFHTHSIYYIENGNNKEVTVNYPVRSGKTTRNEVIVFLDGIPVSTNIIEK